jgi:hypothetical protein
MTASLPARSRNCRDSRPRAAVHQRPSGRSRSPRIDPSTITSPTPQSSTQISPGVRGTIGTTPPHNHSPPRLDNGPGSDKRRSASRRPSLLLTWEHSGCLPPLGISGGSSLQRNEPQQSAAAMCGPSLAERSERLTVVDHSTCSRLTSRRSPVRGLPLHPLKRSRRSGAAWPSAACRVDGGGRRARRPPAPGFLGPAEARERAAGVHHASSDDGQQ